MSMRAAELDFYFRETFHDTPMPEAYERLLLDALSGDASLFARSDEILLAWKLVDAIRLGWQGDSAPPLQVYERGSWGPTDSDRLLGKDGRWWERESDIHRTDVNSPGGSFT